MKTDSRIVHLVVIVSDNEKEFVVEDKTLCGEAVKGWYLAADEKATCKECKKKGKKAGLRVKTITEEMGMNKEETGIVARYQAEQIRLRKELEQEKKEKERYRELYRVESIAAHDAQMQRDYALKKKLVCSHCDTSFRAIDAVQKGTRVYCSKECADIY